LGNQYEKPRNRELDYLRHRGSGTCWWCGRVANSREHKYKRTDLDRLQNEGGPLVWGGDPDRYHNVRSTKKSGAVRFRRSLCQACNGARSQPFDRAYDEYVAFIWRHVEEMWSWDDIPMDWIFGDDWPTKQLDLARYFAKHFGCRISEEGFTVPSGITEFMNGAETARNIRMCFSKHEDIWELHQALRGIGGEVTGFWLGGMVAYLTRDRSRILGLETNVLLGFIGVELFWNDREPIMDSFFPHKNPVLNRITATPEVIEEIRARRRDLESGDTLGT